MAEVIIFPKHQQRQLSSEDYIATTKRVLAEQGFPEPPPGKSGPKISVAACSEIMPHVIEQLHSLLKDVERDAQEGRNGLAFMIGMYEHMLGECHAMNEVAPLGSANSENIGAPAQAAEHAKVFKTSESLSSWLLGLVDEWSERDSKIYSVAEGGRCVAEKREDTNIEAAIFEVIEEQVGCTFYATELRAGIARLQELERARQAIERTSNRAK